MTPYKYWVTEYRYCIVGYLTANNDDYYSGDSRVSNCILYSSCISNLYRPNLTYR